MTLWMTDLPAFIPFYLAALAIPFLRGKIRAAVMLAAPVAGIAHLAGVEPGTAVNMTVLGFAVIPYSVDALNLVFGYLFHLAAFIAIIFSLHLNDTRQHVSAMIYSGSAVGAVFAGDLMTLFLFWEMLAISSVFLILAGGTDRARSAAMRYLVIQALSGVLLLAGALVWYRQTGTLQFQFIGLESVAGVLILFAFAIKCAFPLLHNWLTDAYPESSPTGAVFLSAFSTKVGIYALVRGYPGTELLIYIGAVMACFPMFFAVIENDLRRVLTYSMISQSGYMVVGVGIGTELALNGTVAHAFVHVIYKALLLMSMGAVLHMTGRIHGSDLGGLYKSMPWTAGFCIVGAASISALPLFSGFISKAMILSAALYEGHTIVWMMLLFAAAGVLLYAGIRVPLSAFFDKDSGLRPGEAPPNMLIAMAGAAVLCVVVGSFPSLLYGLLPFDTNYTPYDATHVLTQLQLLFFAAAVFAWLRLSGAYPPQLHATNIDVEWVYRRFGPRLVSFVAMAVGSLDRMVRDGFMGIYRQLVYQMYRHHGPQGTLARTWPTGSMTLWVAILLAATLILYFI
jgi:multicomponent Na+:H+ antiporter subunit D